MAPQRERRTVNWKNVISISVGAAPIVASPGWATYFPSATYPSATVDTVRRALLVCELLADWFFWRFDSRCQTPKSRMTYCRARVRGVRVWFLFDRISKV